VAAPRERRLRELVGPAELAILLVSYALFLYYFSASHPVRYYDENHYLSLAKLLWEQGPQVQTELHAQRTYLYPLLLSWLLPITGWDPPGLKTIVATVQYGVLVATVIYLAAGLSQRDVPRVALARRAVLVAGLWNPYLVQATTLVLTDSLAACAIAFSVAAAWRLDVSRFPGALASVGVAAAGAMLRPAALPALGLVLATVGFRVWVKGDVRAGAFAWRGVACLAVMLPQLALNLRNFGLWSVLPQIPMYQIQQYWAASRLRWLTSVDSRSPGGIAYLSPVPVGPNETIFTTIFENPLAFVVAYGAHWFHILDWGFVEIYVADLYAPSRIVGSVFVYTVWLLAAWGAVALWRRSGPSLELDGHWLVLGLAALAYAAFVATTQMETRYAYPVMLLALAFVGPGAVAATQWLRGGAGLRRAFAGGFAYIGVTLGLLWLSLRLDLTTGRIDWFKHYFG
jgi:hypothetical protein